MNLASSSGTGGRGGWSGRDAWEADQIRIDEVEAVPEKRAVALLGGAAVSGTSATLIWAFSWRTVVIALAATVGTPSLHRDQLSSIPDRLTRHLSAADGMLL
jgi:hypothetical protein